MLKKLAIGCGALFVVAILVVGALGWWFYRQMTGPMYVPGDLAATTSLALPAPHDHTDDENEAWTVEPGIRLHHFARGAGRPVLFIHGGPGFPTRTPMPWLDAVYASREVHFYDQRGCGASRRPFDRFSSPNVWANMQQLEGTLGLGAQIADIERIRRLLGVEKLTLVGHSFGGFLATLYAIEFPDHVDKLVLLAPADTLVMPADRDDLFSLVRERLPASERVAYDEFLAAYLDFGALFTHDETTLARRHVELGAYILRAMGQSEPALPDEGVPPLSGGWMVYAMYLSMGQQHDYTSALARIRADTLVVHGTDDLQPEAGAAQYVRLIPGAQLVRVPGGDHFFSGRQPELVERVIDFLGP